MFFLTVLDVDDDDDDDDAPGMDVNFGSFQLSIP